MAAERAMSWRRFLVLSCAALVVAVAPAAPAQSNRAGPDEPARKDGRADRQRQHRDLEKNRRRWEELSPKQRKQIKAISRQLRNLTAAERRILLEKLRDMEPEKRRESIRRAREKLDTPPQERHAEQARRALWKRLVDELTPAQRRELKKLPPRERGRFLADLQSGRRERLIRELPDAIREKALALPPREQVEYLRRHRAGETARRTFRPREIEAIRRLPQREVSRLFRLKPGRDAPPRPPFLSEASWRRWRELKPYERPRVIRLLRERDRRGTLEERRSRRETKRAGPGERRAKPATPASRREAKRQRRGESPPREPAEKTGQ